MYSGLSVFDLDHTLLTVNCSYHFGFYLYKHHYFSRLTLYRCLFYYMRHKLLNMPMDHLHERIFKLMFEGLSKEGIDKMVQLFLKKQLETLLHPVVLQRLLKAKEEGHYTIILSSSPDFLVGPIAKKLQVDNWQATAYAQDHSGCFNSISKVIQGQDKANYVQDLSRKLGLDRSSIVAYSDSVLDLPVLQLAGKVVGVQPDAQLRHLCHKHDWEILS